MTLYVSSGPGKVAVPNVEGKSEATAETTLQNDGFSVGVQQDPTSTEPAGTVVNQNPVGNTMVDPGSKVTITVSGAATVPNVVGLSEQSAQASSAAERGLQGERRNRGLAGTTPGNVWQENPSANSTAAPGTTVTILVQPQASPSPTGSPTAPPSATTNPTRPPAPAALAPGNR